MPLEEKMAELRRWYRRAMEERIASLDALVPDVLRGRPEAAKRAREIAHLLRGSGGSYGFPRVTEVAALVEDAANDDMPPRLLGLVDLLRDVAAGVEDAVDARCHGWVFHLLDVPERLRERLVPGPGAVHEVWERLEAATGRTPAALARAMADALRTDVADLDRSDGAALRLVPAELAGTHGVLPLRQDENRLFFATSHPTDAAGILALEGATGRTAVPELLPPTPLGDELDRAYEGVSGPRRRPPGDVRGDGDGPDDTAAPRVLVVDDDRGARVLARAVLEKEGIDVDEAGSGEEALARLRDGPIPDLVVLDLHMPDASGVDVLETIRADDSLRAVPVVVLTGDTDAGTEVELMERGADDFIRKPLEPRLFRARVRATLRRVEPV